MADTVETTVAPGGSPAPRARATGDHGAPALVAFAIHRARTLRWGLCIVVVALAALLPEYAGVDELSRVQQILFYIMVAFGLNIGLGFAGEFAVAQPVVYGLSAYTAGVMSVHWGISPWLTLPTAVAFGSVTGFLLSAPGFRRLQGWYLAVTTFFAAVVFPHVVNLFSSLTGGSNGLAGIAPLPTVGLVLGSSARLYWILLVIALVLMLGMYNLSRSTWGVVLRGIRTAPRAVQACGVNVGLAKAFVSVVASFPVALAGWAFAHASDTISTGAFTLNLAIIIVAGVVIGGMGTVWGPVVGTVIVELISLWVGPFSDYNTLLVGCAVVFFAVVMPKGIVHAWGALWGRIGTRRGWTAPPVTAVAAAGGADAAALAFSGVADVDGALDREAGLTAAAPSEAAVGAFASRAPVAPGETVLQVEGVQKRFSGVVVLDGVDITIRRGEVVGLIGPNGSGKTTLLNALTGHVRADGGTILLFGKTIRRRSPHAIASAGIRRTFQVPRLISELSVIENIRLGLLGGRRQEVFGSILRLPGYLRRAKRHVGEIEAVCELVGLDRATWHQRVDSLPLGTRRVVEVARAVVAGPAVVCLDEPGAGLGGEALEVLGRVMRRVADAGSAVVVIEHNLDFVRGVTDRVVEMQDGRVVAIPEGGTARAAAAGPAV